MKLKTLFTEVLLLLAIAALSITTAYLISPAHKLSQPIIDLQIHDIYLVIRSSGAIVFTFCLLSTLIYFIKEWFHRFSRRLQSVIFIIINSLFVLELCQFFIVAAALNPGNISPDLSMSALPNAAPGLQDSPAKSLIEHLPLIAIILLIISLGTLITGTLLTGKSWTKSIIS